MAGSRGPVRRRLKSSLSPPSFDLPAGCVMMEPQSANKLLKMILPLAGLTRPRIEAIMAQKQPHPARNLLKALRAVVKIAMRSGFIEADPTLGVYKPRVRNTGGFRTWTDSEIAQFEAHYPVGTRERLAFGLMIFTGQRRADIIRMGRQHIKGEFLEVRQQKTGAVLRIPLHRDLQTILAAHRADNLTFLVTRTGQPFVPGLFQIGLFGHATRPDCVA